MSYLSDLWEDLEDWWDEFSGSNDFGGSHEALEAMPDNEDMEDFQSEYNALADLAEDIDGEADQEAWDELRDELFTEE